MDTADSVRESIVTAAAVFGVFLCLGTIGMGLWLILRERRWILGATAVATGVVALFTGLLASTKYWFGGLAVIDLELRQLAGNLVIDWLAVAGGIIVLAIAFWFFRSRRFSHAIYAIGIIFLAMGVSGAVLVSQSDNRDYAIEGEAAIPMTQRTDPSALEITMPEEFAVRTIIDDAIGHPTALSFGPDSTLYISDVEGHIWYSEADENGDYTEPALLVENLNAPLGLAWFEDELYVSSAGRIDALQIGPDNQVLESREVVTDIPAQIYVFHQNNQLAFGPDGRGYVGVGATSDIEPETVPMAASILSFDPQGNDLKVVATGLRNPYGIAFDASGQLWVTDNGPAVPFNPEPPEELNAIVEGKHYGFPESYGTWYPEAVGEPPVAIFPPHSSADGIVVYPEAPDQDFPSEYAGDIFVAAWSTGLIYRVQIHEDDGTHLQRTSIFASGFVNPLALAVDSDGKMLIADYTTQSVFEVYTESP